MRQLTNRIEFFLRTPKLKTKEEKIREYINNAKKNRATQKRNDCAS